MNLATSEMILNHYALLWWAGQELVKELTGFADNRGPVLDAKKEEKSHDASRKD